MRNEELPNNLGIPRLTRKQMGSEIVERIRCARQWCQRHWQLLCNPDLSSRSKFQLYKAFVRPILTYACELWDLNEYESKKLLRYESGVLVEIYKSKYPQRHPKRLKPRLKSVYKRFRGRDVVEYVNFERLRWTELLMQEERALRRIRDHPIQTISWWDKACVCQTTQCQQSSEGTSTFKDRDHNVESKQSTIIGEKGLDGVSR